MDSPLDPVSSVRMDSGPIIEPDSRRQDQFDMIDRSITDYAIDVERTEQAMHLETVEMAHVPVDVHVSQEGTIAIIAATAPARAVEVMARMSMAEIMMAPQKMRTRRALSSQCRITSLEDDPVQIVADTAEAKIHDFSKQETTVGVARYAPFNALVLLVGSWYDCPGMLARYSVEKTAELELGARGLASYVETVSACGTEVILIDSDDTPRSKASLILAYASRGSKVHYISDTGSEVLMGYSESKSMLYLEPRCILITKGIGVQRLQNDTMSCIDMAGAVPSGIRAVLTENLIASMFDLKTTSVNSQALSHSDIRRTTCTLIQMSSGTSFTFSGYDAVSGYDSMFVGSNLDVEGFNDYNILQRDLMADGDLCPITEAGTIAIHQRAAWMIRAVFRELGLPPIADGEMGAATYTHGSNEMLPCDMVGGLNVMEEMMERNITGLDIIDAPNHNGFEDIVSSTLNMLRQRVTGNCLQTSAILDRQFEAASAVNDINDYQESDTDYRISAGCWMGIKNIPDMVQPGTIE